MNITSDFKITIDKNLGSEYIDNYQTHGSYGGASNGSASHGHDGKLDDIDIDREKFFREVYRFLIEYNSKKMKYPLSVVARKEHHSVFKEADLREKIKEINDKRFDVLVDKEIEHYHNINNDNLNSNQLIILAKDLLA